MTTPSTPVDAVTSAAAPDGRGRRVERVVWIVGAVLAAAVVVIVVVRAVTSDWLAAGDFAVLRMRTLDVGTGDTPLVGVYSRYGWDHPGPFVFYALAPIVRIVGGASYGLLLGALAVNLAAIAAVLWLARRAGALALAAFAAVLAVTVFAFGAEELFDPWNPFLPILPLVAAAVAAWRCLESDRVGAIVLVVSASFAAQAHVGSAPMALTMAAIGAWGIARASFRSPCDDDGDERVDERHRARVTGLLALAVGFVCWIPPIVQQLHPGSQPGNLRAIASFFLHGSEPVVGLRNALGLTSRLLAIPSHLDVGWSAFPGAGARIPWLGLLLLAATVWAWRRGWRAALALDLVAWFAIGAFVIGASRVAGAAYPYLFRWGWVAVVIVWAGIVLTLATAAADRWTDGVTWSEVLLGAVAALALVGTLSSGVDMSALDGWSDEMKAHQALVAPALDAVRAAPAPVLLETTNAMIDGTVANQLLLEAGQQGIDLRRSSSDAYIFGAHRTVDPAKAPSRLIVTPVSRADEIVATTSGRIVTQDDEVAVVLVR